MLLDRGYNMSKNREYVEAFEKITFSIKYIGKEILIALWHLLGIVAAVVVLIYLIKL